MRIDFYCTNNYTLYDLTEDDYKRLLIQRGFTEQEIDSNFSEYVDGNKWWEIVDSSREGFPDISSDEFVKMTDVDKIRALYRKQSVKLGICSVAEPSEDFEKYSNRPILIPEYLNAAILEPFIARLILALNNCGIFTSQSCDAWDNFEKTMIKGIWIDFRDRYSSLWYKILLEKVCGENKSWFLLGKTYTQDKPSSELYKRFNLYAEFFEENCKKLREIRTEWIEALQDSYSNQEIRALLKSEKLEKQIVNLTKSRLLELKRSWNSIKSRERSGIQCWNLVEMFR